MRVTKPNTDLVFDFKIIANGKACDEYTLPNRETDEQVAECFVAVPEGAKIEIQGTLTGSILHARLDVLADGSFAKSRVIDAPNHSKGKLKFHKSRSLDCNSGFLNVPDTTLDPNRPHRKPAVYGGNLIVKPLPEGTNARFLDGDGDTLGVGSIALVFSCNQVASKTYGKDGTPAYPDNTLGSWRQRRDEIHGVGIRPEHQLEMEVYTDSNPAKDKKASAFWRDYATARFGEGPIATMVFYYRTQATLEAAGCVPLPDKVELAPFKGSFTSVENEENGEGLPMTAPSKPLPKKTMGIGKPLILNPTADAATESATGRHERESTIMAMIRNYDQAANQHDRSRAAQRQPEGAATTRTTQNVRARMTSESMRSEGAAEPDIKDEDDEEDIAPRLAARRPGPAPAAPMQAKPSQTTGSPMRAASPKESILFQAPPKRPATSSPSSSTPPPKRSRLEDLAAQKAALQAAAASRKARKEKVEAETREREQARKKWEAEEAVRRAEEEATREMEEKMARELEAWERKKRAEEAEAEALEAELAVLAREGEDEDEEIAKMEREAERERVEFEALKKGRAVG